MDERESLQQLISRGEGKALEFKSAIPSPQHLAREIAAFANSRGGTILLGVREDGTIPGVFDCPHDVASNAFYYVGVDMEVATSDPADQHKVTFLGVDFPP